MPKRLTQRTNSTNITRVATLYPTPEALPLTRLHADALPYALTLHGDATVTRRNTTDFLQVQPMVRAPEVCRMAVQTVLCPCQAQSRCVLCPGAYARCSARGEPLCWGARAQDAVRDAWTQSTALGGRRARPCCSPIRQGTSSHQGRTLPSGRCRAHWAGLKMTQPGSRGEPFRAMCQALWAL